MPRKDKRSPLDKLTKHWRRASDAERRAFLEALRQEGVLPKTGTFSATGAASARRTGGASLPSAGMEATGEMIANGRYLLPMTVARIEAIMIRRRIGPAEVMAEAGFAGDGAVLTRALIRQASLRLSVIAALRDWLAENEACAPAAMPDAESPASQQQPSAGPAA